MAAHLTDPKAPSAALVAIDPATARSGRWSAARTSQGQVQQRHPGPPPGRQLVQDVHPGRGAWRTAHPSTSVWHGPPSDHHHRIPTLRHGRPPWQPHNYADESGGTMNLVEATAHSVNTIFAQLVARSARQTVVDVAHRMGITHDARSPCARSPSGSQEVTPLDMTDAYATLAAGGRSPPRRSRSRVVKSSDGQALYTRDAAKGDQALDPNDADARHLRAAARRHRGHRDRRGAIGGRWPARPGPPRTTWTPGSAATRRSWPPACGWGTRRPRHPMHEHRGVRRTCSAAPSPP